MSDIPHTNISRLVVKNYRSLADVDIALRPLTILVGKNGVGKSNVIDVLRFVRDVLNDGLRVTLNRHGSLRGVRCWYADETEEISIHLTFEGPLWWGEYGFAFGASEREGDEFAIKSEKLSYCEPGQEPLVLEAVDGKLVRFPSELGGIPMWKLCYTSWPQRYRTTLFLPQLARYEARLQTVRVFLANMNFYDIAPDKLREPQKVDAPFPLKEDGSNLAATLRELKPSPQQNTIIEGMRLVVEGFDNYSTEYIDGHLVTKLHYVTQNGKVHKVDADLRYEADGTLRLLAILTALYQDRYLSPLTIEEPEKALSLDTLGVLYDVLDEAAISHQVIMTTHSPNLSDHFPVDSFLVVEKEHGVTKIGSIAKKQQESMAQQLFSLGELMEIEGLKREKPTT